MLNNPFGFLIIDKPTGITSHDCVNVIRKVFKIRKVGHGGTLDPGVTGVLPMAIGNATRLFKYLPGEKRYHAIIQLGYRTSTDDMNGELISKEEFPFLDKGSIENILNSFRGNIQQKPPLISSIHYQGERAYKRARKGEKFELPMRPITIHELHFCKWDQDTGQLQLNIQCSAGTYIRSLARDLGENLGCGGCLLKLRRTEAQGFTENQSILLPKLKDGRDETPTLINPIDALSHLLKTKLKTQQELNSWRRGQSIDISTEPSFNRKFVQKNNCDCQIKNVAVVDHQDELAGIGEWSTNSFTIKPKVVFNAYG